MVVSWFVISWQSIDEDGWYRWNDLWRRIINHERILSGVRAFVSLPSSSALASNTKKETSEPIGSMQMAIEFISRCSQQICSRPHWRASKRKTNDEMMKQKLLGSLKRPETRTQMVSMKGNVQDEVMIQKIRTDRSAIWCSFQRWLFHDVHISEKLRSIEAMGRRKIVLSLSLCLSIKKDKRTNVDVFISSRSSLSMNRGNLVRSERYSSRGHALQALFSPSSFSGKTNRCWLNKHIFV